MIRAHQPKIFGSRVIAAVSSIDDGNMRSGVDDSEQVVYENRRKFLSQHMIAMQSSVLCKVTYDRTDYTHYASVEASDRGKGMLIGSDVIVADALATDDKSCALFLSLADCTGAILYDTARQGRLMIAHLGRHSTEQYGAKKCIEFMQDTFGSRPEDILVWLSPAPNGTDYPLWKRDNKSFREATLEDLHSAGITSDHIEICDVDTVTSKDYFSHSEFLKGRREDDGCYGIVAKMR